jgi:hypothetical protein
MATGPQHYLYAEELLEQVKTISNRNDAALQTVLLEALVHATLAQAAATAPVSGDRVVSDWTKAVR